MSKENVFWMSQGSAYFLGANPKERTGVSPDKLTVVQVKKDVSCRTEYTDRTIWIGDDLCAIFVDPTTKNQYAQPIGRSK